MPYQNISLITLKGFRNGHSALSVPYLLTYDGNLTHYDLSGLQSRPDSLCPKLFNLRSSHIFGADPGFSERGFGQTSEVRSSQEKVRSKYLRLFHFRGFDRTTRATERLRPPWHVAKYNIRRSRTFDLPNHELMDTGTHLSPSCADLQIALHIPCFQSFSLFCI